MEIADTIRLVAGYVLSFHRETPAGQVSFATEPPGFSAEKRVNEHERYSGICVQENFFWYMHICICGPVPNPHAALNSPQ